MESWSVPIRVDVPAGGLRRYSFFSLGYQHNQPVPDRRTGWTVGRGVPLPRGAVREVEALRLSDGAEKPIARQIRPLAHWDDGSVMFAHVAWQADVSHDQPASFTLSPGGAAPATSDLSVRVAREGERVTIDGGTLRAEVGRTTQGQPTLALTRRGRPLCDGPLRLWTRDGKGREYVGVLDRPLAIVAAGPVLGVVELRGRHHAGESVFLDFVLRIRIDAGRDDLTLTHTFINMGDEPDGVPVGEIGLALPKLVGAALLTHGVCQVTSGQNSFSRIVELPEPVQIDITATGPRIADLDSLREDTSGYPSYLMYNRDMVEPWIGVRGPDWSLAALVLEGKQNFPKRLRIGDGVLECHLWPEGAKLQDLRQGMARTHHLRLAFFAPDAPATDWHTYSYQCEAPANVAVPFEWYQRCRVFGMDKVMAWMPTRYPRIEGNLLACPERGWAAGMLTYGDDPNSGYDYTFLGMPAHTIYINNEHDYTSAAVIQSWRSGRAAAWNGARLSAEHQIDVDFVRKCADRWKEGGIPAHSYFHTSAAVYPSHTWTEGLVQYYCTSGDERALEVAKSLGHNLCMYVEERPEVFGTESRMVGWALIALAAVIEVTHDERVTRAAQTLRDFVGEAVDRDGGYDLEGLNYGTGTVLTGLCHLHRILGDTRALEIARKILDWHLVHGQNALGVVWSDYPQPYNLNLTLPAYAYLWHATGDPKYRDEGLAFFRYTGPPDALSDIRGGAKQYRTYVPFLGVAHEAGVLEEMEKRVK